jgi:hypothetical protein
MTFLNSTAAVVPVPKAGLTNDEARGRLAKFGPKRLDGGSATR